MPIQRQTANITVRFVALKEFCNQNKMHHYIRNCRIYKKYIESTSVLHTGIHTEHFLENFAVKKTRKFDASND